MDSLLVTGGAGFIGSTFVRHVLANYPVRVANLDKLTYAGNLDSLASVLGDPRHVFIQGDIADRGLVEGILAAHRPTAIVNFAAESHVDRSIDGPSAFVQTNVVGTFELLEAARAHWSGLTGTERSQFRFLQVSTDEVFGSLGANGHFTEQSPYSPNSPYSASKAAADHLVRAYHHTYGLPVLTSNCSNNYGPYQFPEKLIPLVILNAIEGKPLPVYGDGRQIRDWLYVEDHCRALWTVLAKGEAGQVYAIGGQEERTNLDVVRTICGIVDRFCDSLPNGPRTSLIRFVQDRPGHDRRYAIDCSKIKDELGWRQEQDFESGLTRTVEWYLGNSHWIERVTSGAYQRERLGLPQFDPVMAPTSSARPATTGLAGGGGSQVASPVL